MKRKKMKRPSTQEARLKHAAKWVRRYTGKQIIKKYNRKYSISLEDCVKELAMLGLPITQKDLLQYKKLNKEWQKAKQARKKRKQEEEAASAWLANQESSFEEIEYPHSSPIIKRPVRTLKNLRYIQRRDDNPFHEPATICEVIPF